MLNQPPARQMFQRYLNSERLHGILLCLRELMSHSHCDDNCSISNASVCEETEKSLSIISDAINSPNAHSTATDIDIHREQIDADLMLLCKSTDRTACQYLSIYASYLSIGASEASDDIWRFAACAVDPMMPYRLLGEWLCSASVCIGHISWWEINTVVWEIAILCIRCTNNTEGKEERTIPCGWLSLQFGGECH